MANLTLTSGADLWQPGLPRDVLTGALANLSPADVIDLGAGQEEDVFVLTSAGVFDTRAGGNAANITGYERLNLAAGATTVFLTNALVMAAYAGTVRAGQFAVLGNGGSDTIDASLVGATGRITLVVGGGNDTFLGGAGNDLVRFNAVELTASDSINAGAGFDTLRLDTAGAVAVDGLANVRRIETIELATGGSSVSIAQAMAASADGGVLAVVARGGANAVDASAATTAVNYFAGAGADSYVGGTGADRVHVTPTTLTSADNFQGGGGAATDMIRITAPGTFAADAFAGVRGFERIQMSAGGNAITLNDAVFTGVASTPYVVGEGGNDNVDASAMTRAITFDPGAGNDRFTGGSGNDFLVIDPVLLAEGDVFNGGAGRDRVVLKAAGAANPNAGGTLAGFEEIALAAGGNTLPAFTTNAAYAVLGGAGTDDVTLFGSTATASLGGGDDILRIDPLQPVPVADGGTGFDRILPASLAVASTVTIGAGLTGFEAVTVTSNMALQFTGPAQAWQVDGNSGVNTVTTGAGFYDIRLGENEDHYRVVGGSFVNILDGGTTGDTLLVGAGSTAVVVADLGALGDAYTVRGGSQVVINDSGFGNDTLNGFVQAPFTQVAARLGDGFDLADLAPQAGWLIDLGGQDDTVFLRAGAAGSGSGMLVSGADGSDRLVLEGSWGAVTVDTRASDQLVGAEDGGAVQTGFERFFLGNASSATVTIDRASNVTLTSGDDQLFLLDSNLLVAGSGGAGTDTVTVLNPGAGVWDLSFLSGFEIFNGGAGNDLIDGTDAAETINGGLGNDYIIAGGGADILTGGLGIDRFQYDVLSDAGDTITDFNVSNSTVNAQDLLWLVGSGSMAVQAGSNGLVTVDGGAFFPANTSVLLVTAALANAAAVDAYLASRPVAPVGGVFVAAPLSNGGPVAVWHDASAIVNGVGASTTRIVTLANVTNVTALLDQIDVL